MKNGRALYTVTAAFGDNPLRTVRNCETPEDMWEKLEKRYAGTSMVHRLGIFNILVNTMLKGSAGMGDDIPTVVSYFLRLAFMVSEIEGLLRAVIFLRSFSEKVEYREMIPSVNTMQDKLSM